MGLYGCVCACVCVGVFVCPTRGGAKSTKKSARKCYTLKFLCERQKRYFNKNGWSKEKTLFAHRLDQKSILPLKMAKNAFSREKPFAFV